MDRTNPRAEQRLVLPKSAPVIATLIAACLLFCIAFTNEITALAALCLAFSFSSSVLRSRILAAIVAVPAVLSFLMTSTFTIVAIPVAFMFSIGLGAAALLLAKRSFVIACFAASFVLAIFVTMDLLRTCVMIPPMLCAVLLAVTTEKKMRRTSAVCLVTGVLLLVLGIIVLLAIREETGSVSTAFFADLISEIHARMLAIFKESAALLDPSVRPLYTEHVFNGAFDTVLCVLPAMIILPFVILVFLAQSLQFALCVSTDYFKKMTERSAVFALSPVTAALYLIAALLAAALPLFTEKARAVVATAENLVLLLMPGLVLVGFFGIRGFFEKNASCMNVWVILGALAAFYFLGSTLFYIVAMIGVYLTFRVNRVHPSLR